VVEIRSIPLASPLTTASSSASTAPCWSSFSTQMRSVAALQADLDTWRRHYTHERP
jgi:hypothetical protein